MKLAILGAGAWGTALAIALARSSDSLARSSDSLARSNDALARSSDAQARSSDSQARAGSSLSPARSQELPAGAAARHAVTLWARDPGQAEAIAATRRNQRYLPEVAIPSALSVTADLAAALAGSELLVLATPVAGLRELAGRLLGDRASTPLVCLCKGFEKGSGLLPHQVVEAASGAVPPQCGVLSGPSFALEVAQGLPCALTLAAHDEDFARRTAAALHGGRLRVYYTNDLVGVEIGGALKNVLAIAVGISDGMGLGENARAALVTRGLAEIQRLGVALGAAPETIMGLTGAGDLILTATGTLSRNRRVGLELARGRRLGLILADLGHVAEGVRSAREALALAERHHVDLPITRAVNAVLAGAVTAQAALEQLLSRDPGSESKAALRRS